MSIRDFFVSLKVGLNRIYTIFYAIVCVLTIMCMYPDDFGLKHNALLPLSILVIVLQFMVTREVYELSNRMSLSQIVAYWWDKIMNLKHKNDGYSIMSSSDTTSKYGGGIIMSSSSAAYYKMSYSSSSSSCSAASMTTMDMHPVNMDLRIPFF